MATYLRQYEFPMEFMLLVSALTGSNVVIAPTFRLIQKRNPFAPA